jgi:hypothetical protein
MSPAISASGFVYMSAFTSRRSGQAFLLSLDGLLASDGEWQRDLRRRFREGLEIRAPGVSDAPIKEDERDQFAAFVTRPFE